MGSAIESRLQLLPDEQLEALMARARRLAGTTTTIGTTEREAWAVIFVKCLTEHTLRAAEVDGGYAARFVDGVREPE